MRALEQHGLLVRENDRYRLGTRLLHLGTLVRAAYPARQVALPFMQALRDATGQSVQWVVRDGLEGVYLEVVEARFRVRLYVAPGRRAPLYAGASTRLLLTFAPKSVQEAIFQGERVRYTPATPVVLEDLQKLLAQTYRTGFAASFGELEPHSAELAAPIRGPEGEVVAALSLAGAEAHYRDPKMLSSYLQALSQSAREISEKLGFVAPWQADLKGFLSLLLAVQP